MYKHPRNIIAVVTFRLLLVTTFFSCGPRTGIHNDSTETDTQKNQPFVCGNAMRDQVNYERAFHTLGFTGDGNRGAKLFKQNCAVCHSTLDMKIIGPGLKDIFSRIPEPKGEWLKNYILNSTKVYKSGDPYAKQLRKQFREVTMPAFEGDLQEKEMNDLLIYIFGSTN